MRTVAKAEAVLELAEMRETIPEELKGCIMCALAARAALPDLYVCESEHAVCVLDAFAARKGHALVVAKQHLENMRDVPWAVQADMSRLAWETARVLEGRGAKRVYVAQLGSAVELPFSFAHAHIHVVPIEETDERARPAAVFSWTTGVQIYERGEGEALAREIESDWHRQS